MSQTEITEQAQPLFLVSRPIPIEIVSPVEGSGLLLGPGSGYQMIRAASEAVITLEPDFLFAIHWQHLMYVGNMENFLKGPIGMEIVSKLAHFIYQVCKPSIDDAVKTGRERDIEINQSFRLLPLSAVIPEGTNGYVLFDPHTGCHEMVDAADPRLAVPEVVFCITKPSESLTRWMSYGTLHEQFSIAVQGA